MEALTLDYNAFAAPEQCPVICAMLITREERIYIYIEFPSMLQIDVQLI
jgi:hypothetical protein